MELIRTILSVIIIIPSYNIGKDNMIEQLLNDPKKMREDMVAKNYPSSAVIKFDSKIRNNVERSKNTQVKNYKMIWSPIE